MRQIKIGDKDKNYLEFRKSDSCDKIMITAMDDSDHKSEFSISQEELEVVYRYMIGDNEERTDKIL